MRAILLICVAACAVPTEDEATVDDEIARPSYWTTVDSFDNGGQGADANSVAIWNNSKVIVVGEAWQGFPAGSVNGKSIWTIRTSTTGTGFVTDATFDPGTNKPSGAERVVVDGTGRVFVSGHVTENNGTAHWVTLMSPTGTGYSVVDDVIVSSNVWDLEVRRLVSYGNAVYALAGIAGVSRLRYTTNGTSWADAPLPPNAGMLGPCSTSLGLVATGVDNAGNAVTMATSDPMLAPWTPIDVVTPANIFDNVNTTCTQVNGAIYVAGYGPSDTSYVHRAPVGGAWATVDSATEGGAPWAISGYYNGRVFVTGNTYTAGPPKSMDWLTRGQTAFGVWGEFDRKHPIAPNFNSARDMAFTSGLGLFVVGDLDSHATIRHC
jgi:hypothetical protein